MVCGSVLYSLIWIGFKPLATQYSADSLFICASHEVAPEFREFERLSTTAVNAYLGPVMEGYIRRLSARLRDLGLTVTPQLTQSNGGVIGFEVDVEHVMTS